MKTRLIGILVLTIALAGGALAQTRVSRGEGGERPQSIRAGQVIVRLAPGTRVGQLKGTQGARIVDQIAGTDYYLLELPDGANVHERVRRLYNEPEIVEATPNYTYSTAEVLQTSQAFIDQTSQAFIDQTSQAFIDAGVPVSFTRQKLVSNLHLVEAQVFSRGSGIKVAIVDTGIDTDHPLFRGKIEYPVYDFVDNDGDPSEERGAGYGHGTFIAGLIALTAPRATLMPLRAFSGDGSGTSFSIARAIRFAADNGADVINMSFGLLEEDSLVKDAVSYAYRRAYLVAAAGNDDQNFIHFPASTGSQTLAVTSTDANDLKASFANYNNGVDVSAPGVDVYSAYPEGRWAFWSGTSFSTGLVSGEAALLLSLRPDTSNSDLDRVILNAGDNIDRINQRYSGKLGKVRIDFRDAIFTLFDRD
jgi:subtilisin family serine protease